MYVCLCNAITDRAIRRAAADGAKDLWDLQGMLGVAAGCGSCKQHAMEVLSEVRDAVAAVPPLPRLYRPNSA